MKKFELKIAPQQNKQGQKQQELTEEEQSWLSKFLSQPDKLTSLLVRMIKFIWERLMVKRCLGRENIYYGL